MHLPATRSEPTEGGKPDALFGWPEVGLRSGRDPAGTHPDAIHKVFRKGPVLLVQVHHVPEARRNRTLNRERTAELRRQFYDEPGALGYERAR